MSAREDAVDGLLLELALAALFAAPLITRERMRIMVCAGHVTLTGSVATEGQRLAALRALRCLPGVLGVIDAVRVEPDEWTAARALSEAVAYGRDAEAGDAPGRVEAVFERDMKIGGAAIRISGTGGHVVLSGRVGGWRERDQAERDAWSTPGIQRLEDRLVVGPVVA